MSTDALNINRFSPRLSGNGRWILNQWCTLEDQEHWINNPYLKYPQAISVLNKQNSIIAINNNFLKAPRYIQRSIIAHEINHLEAGLSISREEVMEMYINGQVSHIPRPIEDFMRLKIEQTADEYAAVLMGADHILRALEYTYSKVLKVERQGIKVFDETSEWVTRQRIRNLVLLKTRKGIVSSGTYYGSIR